MKGIFSKKLLLQEQKYSRQFWSDFLIQHCRRETVQIRSITKPDHWHWHLSISVCIYIGPASQCIALNQSAKQESSQSGFIIFSNKNHRKPCHKMYSCIFQHFKKFFKKSVNVRLLVTHLKLCNRQNLHDNIMTCSHRSLENAHSVLKIWHLQPTHFPIPMKCNTGLKWLLSNRAGSRVPFADAIHKITDNVA